MEDGVEANVGVMVLRASVVSETILYLTDWSVTTFFCELVCDYELNVVHSDVCLCVLKKGKRRRYTVPE